MSSSIYSITVVEVPLQFIVLFSSTR